MDSKTPAEFFKQNLIAPCGMNCAICSGYLAYSRNIPRQRGKITHCMGCRPRNKRCAYIKGHCEKLLNNSIAFCFDCPDFPCQRLETLDKRYRNNYSMSMIENLENIKENGIKQFLITEEKKWKCSECGQVICCHNGICFNCGLSKLKDKKKRYRWEDD